MLRLPFPEATPVREDYAIEDLPERTKIRADIGEDITDIRLVMVVGQFPERDRISVILPGKRMDGPYNIPVKNVYEIIEDAPDKAESMVDSE